MCHLGALEWQGLSSLFSSGRGHVVSVIPPQLGTLGGRGPGAMVALAMLFFFYGRPHPDSTGYSTLALSEYPKLRGIRGHIAASFSWCSEQGGCVTTALLGPQSGRWVLLGVVLVASLWGNLFF